MCIGHIVKDGPADRDPRIQTGDEIVNINGVNVVSRANLCKGWKLKNILKYSSKLKTLIKYK